jgi:nucleolar MIF4G domain-containing protein 1
LHQEKKDVSQHVLISDKRGYNMLLIIVYLYNLRIVHHSLLIDILNDISGLTRASDGSSSRAQDCEALLELVFGAMDNGGSQLRHDDPDAFRGMIAKVVEYTRPFVSKGNSRIDFIVSNIADLNMNKSKRIKSAAEENIGKLRKWLGSIKSLLGSRPGDLCMHVSLNDLLLAENRGRWWRAGAAWVGRDKGNDAPEEEGRKEYTSSVSREQAKLLALAQKMRMNTPLRRDIFVVMMSSSDALDAFERLSRLDLKGKQDREILRVVLECCGQEKTYNEFYSELASLLCEHNRQHKTTLQFSVWDAFKTLEDEQFSNRRAINLARMLSHLVAKFRLSLSVLKVIDMSTISDRMVLFLATFFLALLSSSVCTSSTFALVGSSNFSFCFCTDTR